MANTVIGVYSESGGATKTTTAMSLAVCWALAGEKVTLIDLDPRAAATKWAGVEPVESWQHVGAILADSDPAGWVDELAITVPWPQTPNLSIVPAARQLSNREREAEDHADVRLKLALNGTAADRVILDFPNRQGGPIIQAGLTAATHIVYAATLNEDGLDGVDGAIASVQRYFTHRQQIGGTADLTEAGIIVGAGHRGAVMTRDSRRALDTLHTNYGQLVLEPVVPDRVIVREARAAADYYGWYTAGQPVHQAYEQLSKEIAA